MQTTCYSGLEKGSTGFQQCPDSYRMAGSPHWLTTLVTMHPGRLTSPRVHPKTLSWPTLERPEEEHCSGFRQTLHMLPDVPECSNIQLACFHRWLGIKPWAPSNTSLHLLLGEKPTVLFYLRSWQPALSPGCALLQGWCSLQPSCEPLNTAPKASRSCSSWRSPAGLTGNCQNDLDGLSLYFPPGTYVDLPNVEWDFLGTRGCLSFPSPHLLT